MMPKTSVRPAAIRNSITPSCSPLRVCSRTRTKFKREKTGRVSFRARFLRHDAANCAMSGARRPLRRAEVNRRRRSASGLLLLHPAFLGVGILVVGEDRFLDL